MTLADDILRYGLQAEIPEYDDVPVEPWARTQWTAERLRAATIVNIQNVADFYYESIFRKHTGEGAGISHFPAVIPPWDTAFYEFKINAGIDRALRQNHPANSHRTNERIGLLWERKSDWTVHAKCYSTTQTGRIYGRQEFVFGWLKNGALVPYFYTRAPWGGEFFEYRFSDLDSLGLNASLLAVSLCHCKNVTMKEQTTPPALAKAYTRRSGGKQPFRYHVLNIDPMRQIIRRERAAMPAGADQGLATALHICRGHFKDYRESGGLFGKHKGLYWWDMHVKGSAENGVVDKGYKVKAPAEGDVNVTLPTSAAANKESD